MKIHRVQVITSRTSVLRNRAPTKPSLVWVIRKATVTYPSLRVRSQDQASTLRMIRVLLEWVSLARGPVSSTKARAKLSSRKQRCKVRGFQDRQSIRRLNLAKTKVHLSESRESLRHSCRQVPVRIVRLMKTSDVHSQKSRRSVRPKDLIFGERRRTRTTPDLPMTLLRAVSIDLARKEPLLELKENKRLAALQDLALTPTLMSSVW